MNHCRADTELRLRIERIKQRLESTGQVCAPPPAPAMWICLACRTEGPLLQGVSNSVSSTASPRSTRPSRRLQALHGGIAADGPLTRALDAAQPSLVQAPRHRSNGQAQSEGCRADSHAAKDTSSAANGEDHPPALLAAMQQRAPRQRKASRDAQLEGRSQGRVGSGSMLKASSVEALLEELQHKQQECQRSQLEMQVGVSEKKATCIGTRQLQHFATYAIIR